MANLDDQIVIQVSTGWASPAADAVFAWVSDFPTFGAPLALVILVALTLRNVRRGWAAWLLLLAAVGLADLGGNGLKHLLAQPRPCFALGEQVRQVFGCTSPMRGMPSNHAVEYATAAAFLAVLLRSRKAAVVMGAVALVVGLSRVYLGKHFPTQVLAGWALGAAWGWAAATLAARTVPFVRAPRAGASGTSAPSAPARR